MKPGDGTDQSANMPAGDHPPTTQRADAENPAPAPQTWDDALARAQQRQRELTTLGHSPEEAAAFDAARRQRTQQLLAEFAAYVAEHPEQRFWQALRNWSGVAAVLVQRLGPDDPPVDTFNFEGRQT